jgi:DNA primase
MRAGGGGEYSPGVVIPPEVIEQVRDAADIVALIGEHVELKRTGSDWRGPCPFHGGTHRNFSVVPRKQMYHCFVCHESGDVFTFWIKRFGLDYPTAVREIASKVGIAIPEARAAGPDPNESLYTALAAAAEWMARRLREGEDALPARAYLEQRAVGDEVQVEYQLGFAPPRGEALLEHLRGLGISEETLEQAGLLLRREDGTVAPRFRGRLIFPIADARGRVVGFGGRVLGDGEPKYLNSPETPVFHKGMLLYGLDRARGSIRTEGLAVVVEGYLDVIRLQTSGIGFAVAPLGTALTPDQARVLRRYTRQVALAYDADTAGLRSTFRAGDELLRQGVNVSVVTLPMGEDPDTLVRGGGPEAFRSLLGGAVDLFERKVQLLERKGLFGTLAGRRRALDRLVPTIRAASDPITRGLYLARAAERSGVPRELLEQEVGRDLAASGAHPSAGPGAERGQERAATQRSTASTPDIPAERALVRLMIDDPAWVRRAGAELAADAFRHPVYRRLAEALLSGDRAPPSDDLVAEWERLAAPPESGFDAEAAFAWGVQWLRDRPRRERIAEIDRLVGLASEEEKERLFEEKRELLAATGGRYRRKALEAERRPG